MTQSQKGHGVRNPHTETSSASVLAAGERRWLPARARFAEQVEPSLGRVTAVKAVITYQPCSETGLFWLQRCPRRFPQQTQVHRGPYIRRLQLASDCSGFQQQPRSNVHLDAETCPQLPQDLFGQKDT